MSLFRAIRAAGARQRARNPLMAGTIMPAAIYFKRGRVYCLFGTRAALNADKDAAICECQAYSNAKTQACQFTLTNIGKEVFTFVVNSNQNNALMKFCEALLVRLPHFQIAFHWFLCAAPFLMLSVLLRTQNLTGEIDGVVHDSSGAIIPNALVIITNTGKHRVARSLRTSGQGQFTAPLLVIGEYSVAVEAPGFQATTVSHVAVHVSQPVSVPVILSPGGTAQTVTVTASSVAPQLDTAAAGTLIDGTQVRQLSLSSRNYEQLMTLQPGISEEVPGTIDRGIISTNGGLTPGNWQYHGEQRYGKAGCSIDPNNRAPHKVNRWFNTAAFAQVPAGQYRPGNAPVGDIVDPGYADWDLSLFKNFHIVNSLAMQFRTEAFNTFNHTNFVNFNGVATILGQINFG